MVEHDVNFVVELLIKHEEALADLYTTCSSVFHDNAAFWNRLVVEEKAHAEILRELQQRLKTEQVFLNADKFNLAGVQTAIDHVNRQKAVMGEINCTMVKALSIALDIERAIIDRNFFEIFDTDSAVMKREFSELRVHTVEHSGRIADLLRRIRDY